jgi:hypothetical protein
MIFIDAIEIDERLASHLVGPDPFLRDQLIGFSFSELSIAAPILKLDEPALFVVVVVSHGSKRCFDDLYDMGIRTGRASWHLHKGTSCVQEGKIGRSGALSDLIEPDRTRVSDATRRDLRSSG